MNKNLFGGATSFITVVQIVGRELDECLEKRIVSPDLITMLASEELTAIVGDRKVALDQRNPRAHAYMARDVEAVPGTLPHYAASLKDLAERMNKLGVESAEDLDAVIDSTETSAEAKAEATKIRNGVRRVFSDVEVILLGAYRDLNKIAERDAREAKRAAEQKGAQDMAEFLARRRAEKAERENEAKAASPAKPKPTPKPKQPAKPKAEAKATVPTEPVTATEETVPTAPPESLKVGLGAALAARGQALPSSAN